MTPRNNASKSTFERDVEFGKEVDDRKERMGEKGKETKKEKKKEKGRE